uniref:Uncharacterized protein n=1 Tax=Siphoviridae sp. ctn8e14 TaxID=2827936 RepID=A0A8S5T5Y2_9CAUD|nr:MAG TPA: hypothetical protein [Siphoviridae sp. ctn8e14]
MEGVLNRMCAKTILLTVFCMKGGDAIGGFSR